MIDILAPAEQEGTRAVVRNWLKQIGDSVSENDPLVELETDKVTQEIPAPASGMLVDILLESGAEATPGALLGRMRHVARADTAPVPEPEPEPPLDTNLALSPAVRRAVREHGIDPETIPGTGRGGRITRADVDQAVAARKVAPVPAPAPAPPSPAIATGGFRQIPHDGMRLAIARNMAQSLSTAPHVTALFETDLSAIIAHRARHRATFEKENVNLSYTAYFIAASVAAMKAVPVVNSRWFEDRLEVYDDVNIGIGTALGERGLIVPVVHRAQELSLLGIARRLGELVGRARSSRLSPEGVRGGTFTISNHGVSGSLLAAPIIINQPQSAILGIGKTEKRVVVRTVDGVDTIQIRPMAYVSLTIDHRVLDGHQTNAWLTAFVAAIETWPLE